MRILASAFALSFALPTALAQEEAAVTTTDLGHGIYELSTGRAGNVGLLVGEDGVFMIDTQMEDLAPLIDAAQKEVSGGREVDLVLNTHLHGDHVLGNAYFAGRGAVIMAHANVRPRLVEPVRVELVGRTPEPLSGAYLPSVNLDHGDFVTMNGVTARFHHAPAAHTDGDLFVHFEEADVIHAGDLLFSGLYPFIDLDNGGTVGGFIAGMQMIADLAGPDTVVIAGHGPLSTKADLEASIAMLSEARARVEALVAQGLDLQAIQDENPLADFHADWNWGFITTERMVWTLYRDITGETQ
ncbi:MBL fold metallo-hydrolase [Marinicauda algicola]|uniref:MBL fold metallo-hydrolase n=1 Tax=Marinicauda algicola TaxID=2029849 RepID=A0A4S2H0U3_9PROT|nr:MBL fold metallo-hydrolase [Marinicauda algicola]TGY89167.1 MBL fold metallo-hydrolase [Marinicauda algicola]